MAFQTYDPKTGLQTTYKGETADSGVAKTEYIASKKYGAPAAAMSTGVQAPTANISQSTQQPQNQPANPAPQAPTGVQTGAQQPKTAETGKAPSTTKNTGIDALNASGRVMNETDAKNLAYSKGESNWQQYIGGASGQANPLYIGQTNWAKLQKIYTPYQLEKATTRTKDGIFWNEAVNIGDIPRTDPALQANKDAETLANLVGKAKGEADSLTTGIGATADETQANLATLYNDSATAEDTYNELFNSEEMKSAQADVIAAQADVDKYDQQLEELKDDIRAEVEGEAPESYINALAAVRGDKILRLKRSAQRDLDTATATLSSLKENASNLLSVRVKDSETRYKQLFQMLQLQIQEEGTNFNKEIALANIAMNLPENRSITIGGVTYKGLKENDNLNVVQFTEAGGKTYVIGIDKTTGKEAYRQYIGTAREPSSGGSTMTNVKALAEYQAGNQLEYAKDMSGKVERGEAAIDYDDDGNAFYYDKKSYDAALEDATSGFGWGAFEKNPDKMDFRL